MSWDAIDQFVQRGREFAEEHCRLFPEVLSKWDSVLVENGGDPSRFDWSHFRPLRVGREEDWSDWLQHFIATSCSGRLSLLLFGHSELTSPALCVGAYVQREDVIDNRRADLVIRWSNATRTHVEVKVGDQSFAKTTETAAQLEKNYPPTSWSHYVLLPIGDRPHWDAIDHAGSPAIHVLTWNDVAIALRRTLRCDDESKQWKAWAHGFCGLVEQRLLGHPLATSTTTSLSMLGRRMDQISIMKRGLEDV